MKNEKLNILNSFAFVSFSFRFKQQLEPYEAGSEDKNGNMVKRFSVLDDQSSERMGSGPRCSSSPDYETREIKNIYVDCE